MVTAVMDAAKHAAPPQAVACFHCGLPLQGATYRVTVGGASHETCCRGCQAVAQTIADSGLDAYYRHRSALPARPDAMPDALEKLRLYDLPEVQSGFVRTSASHEKEAALMLEGITCAACAWLIERRLADLPGVTGLDLNYALRRARVRWDENRLRLSDVLHVIAGLGYAAQPYDSARSDDAWRRERRTLLWRLFVAGFGMMQVMMYAVPVYLAEGDMTADIEQLMRIAGLLLTLPVMLWSALPFYAGAWRGLKAGQIGMDVPVVIGIAAAFAASIYATWRGAGEVYFDSVTMFVFLLLGARFLEMGARAKAAQSQERLAKLVPAVAERLAGYPDTVAGIEVPVAALCAGDYVRVTPGASVPADGRVVAGESAVDEALLTGESRPLRKATGDVLTGGSINLQSPLVMRIERVGADTVLAGIIRLMDRAQSEKPRIAHVADRAARWFITVLLAIAAATAAAWYGIDPSRALWITVAVLVVTCPCALSLATPAALATATGALHGMGVLVTRGHALEALAGATHFVFDKTGTLTEGRMSLIGVMPLGGLPAGACMAWAASLEVASEHPVGKAIRAAAEGGTDRGPPATEVNNVPGRGIEARLDGRRCRIGRPDYVAELHGGVLPQELLFASNEVTVVALGDERGWIALFTLGDTVRRGARMMVRGLQARGKTVVLLSGDRPQTVSRLAHELSIEEAHGGATPEDKREYVRALQARGALVAMIGDGVNDAPVLAQAQVSVAMGGGSQLARTQADLVLLSENLAHLARGVAVARRSLRVIRQNLLWSLAYNLVALPLAMAGQVTPWMAGIGMSASSLLVVANSLR
ncbi:MAG: heavy metal translocating P-type ATPase, partial [Burkholderiales bacterium]|nr:heavy metal translocating P-type ATPase [Burkholderiales bacterium]